jgi:hypothetical protein
MKTPTPPMSPRVLHTRDTLVPDGAIWFAQACCSAGSDSPTNYAGLFESGTLLDQTLTGIAKVGADIAPLPRALLDAAQLLRVCLRISLESPVHLYVSEFALHSRGRLPSGLIPQRHRP